MKVIWGKYIWYDMIWYDIWYNISIEINLKFGEYWEISEKDLLKFCQKLENSVKIAVWK